MIKMSKEQEMEIRDLISREETLRCTLKCNNIHLEEDSKHLLTTGNFFFYVGDVTKGLEYYEKAMDSCKLVDIDTFMLIRENLLTLRGDKVGKN